MSPSEILEQRHILVSGRVQGVGFRYFVYEAAERHGVTGWVRNRPDRKVEIRAQGTSPSLEDFLEDVRKGPSTSRVDSVAITDEPLETTFSSFNVKIF